MNIQMCEKGCKCVCFIPVFPVFCAFVVLIFDFHLAYLLQVSSVRSTWTFVHLYVSICYIRLKWVNWHLMCTDHVSMCFLFPAESCSFYHLESIYKVFFTRRDDLWQPQPCLSLNVNHHSLFPLEIFHAWWDSPETSHSDHKERMT